MADQLTPTGLVVQTATEIKADVDAAFKAAYGNSIGSEADGSIPAASSIGQEVAIIVDAKSSASEMLQEILAALDPDQAEDAYLDIICALTGTRRKKQRFSTVLEACAGTIGTVLPLGRVVTVVGTGARFDSLSQATLAVVTNNWVGGHAYALNDLVNANGEIWQCIVAGTSDLYGSGPVAGNHFDGTVTWYPVGVVGQGVALVTFQAEDPGPIAATQGQLTNIATPVDGWVSATNALGTDAASNGLGALVEGNATLRVRRVEELQAQGGGTPDAIRAKILALNGVIACQVFVNNTDVTDGDGIGPHSVCVLILAPSLDDQTLANAVWAATGGGIGTSNAIGTPVSKTVVDASGTAQTVKFSRPTDVPIFVQVTVYYDPLKWQTTNVPGAIGAGTKSAICTFGGDYYQTGYDVRVLPLAASVADGVQSTETDGAGNVLPVIPAPAGSSPMPGIVDVDLQIKKSGGVFGYTAISLNKGEIATFDPNNIFVTASSEAP